MDNKDKELLDVYMWGFNDELEGKQKMWNPNPLLLKAYNLGRDHAIIGDDVRSVKLDKIKAMQIILTMYYRAEHHPHKTKDMIEAQKVFKKWLIDNGYKTAVNKNK